MPESSDDLKQNPLLVTDGLPRFDQIKPEHIVPAVRLVLAQAEQRLTEMEQRLSSLNRPSWDDLIVPLEELDRPFDFAWKPIGHLFGVLNSPELRTAYETVLPEVVRFGLRASQSRPIYDAIVRLNQQAGDSLVPARRRIVDQKLLSAKLSGIALEGAQRERFNAIAEELSQLSTDFSNHVLDATKAFELILTKPEEIEGLPPSLLQLAEQSYRQKNPEEKLQGSAGPWRITLDGPIVTPFLQHSRRRDLRETIYRAFISRASTGEWDNSESITKILKLRREKAELLGYRTFAELSLAEKMAPGVAAVEEMFEKLRAASRPPAEQDLAELKSLAANCGQSEEFKHWDAAFWAERLREQRYDFNDEQLRPYFPLPRVLDGLFALLRKIFGIAIQPTDGEAPSWHPDVRFFRVFDANTNQPLASFYLDPYSRPENKRGGAWMDTCLPRRRFKGQIELPVAHLVCNGTPPVGDTPSLMTFREVETLFHEFGHGLQHMLTTVDEADVAGINGVEWDAVELPSQFMENWCYDRPTIRGLSAHYQTGEPLPDELFDKITAARNFRAASQMLRQLHFGMTDIYLHHQFDPSSNESPFDVQRRMAERTSVMPPLPEDRMLCAFSHIFSGGYAAGYYSYKWAEVLSADAFGAFEEAGLDNEEAVKATGRRFRDTVLSLGGSRHPLEVFRAFRGRDPDPQALLRQCGLT
ncbi:MAG: M3 family metallopeptidase [Planctomycetes bacterium]|nr:M3 family metallopeptidase [Planctomycetota bacterium]